MDTHGLRCSTPMDCLPSSDSLAELGIKKIRVGLEGFGRGEYKLSEIKSTLGQVDTKITKDLEKSIESAKKQLEDFIKRSPIAKDNLEPYIKKLNLMSQRLAANNSYTAFPNLSALLQQIENYEKAGMEIIIEGVDTPEGSFKEELQK